MTANQLPNSAIDVISQQIERHERLYHEAAQAAIRRYPGLEESFPPFLRGDKLITVHFAQNGAVLFTNSSDSFGFRRVIHNARFAEVASTTTGGIVDLQGEWDEPSNVDIAQLEAFSGEGEDRKVLWRSPWERLWLTNDFRQTNWSDNLARVRAAADVQSFLAARLMNIAESPPDDVIAELESSIRRLEALIDLSPREELLQKFLEENSILLCQDAENIYPKVKLGDRYITDFVVLRGDMEHVFVEIEPSSHRLFTQQGNPSSQLSHAERQIMDWQEWMNDNIAYARHDIEELRTVHDPEYWIIIGRKPENKRDEKFLQRMNRAKSYTTLTYDDLLDRARRVARGLKKRNNIAKSV